MSLATLPTTLFGTPLVASVLDEIQGHVQAFMERYIIDEGLNYEAGARAPVVEAKFGTFVDRGTNVRISFPVLSSCVLAPSDWYRFESELSLEQHRAFNALLNEQVRQGSGTWRYRHERTVDGIYIGPQRRKVRVSRESQTGRIIGAMEKRRIADLSLYIPASPLDVRISINTESKVSVTEEMLKAWTLENERHKDRISYEFDHFMHVDLTQVKQAEAGRTVTRHELEVELLHIRTQLEDSTLPARFVCNILDIARHA